MKLLNYLTSTLFFISNFSINIDFISSSFISLFSITSLISFFNNFVCEALIIISIILLASKAQKILDTTSKVVTIATGSTVLYNNWIKGESSGSNESDDKDKKDEDDKNKKDENKEDKTDKPVEQGKSNEK